VARPKVPLISRRGALEAALKIIDEHGLEGLSIRRLADVLGVNGASLYHHFSNKEDILVGAAELALADVRVPQEPADDWRHWLPANARNLRAALVAHPALLPIVVRKRALGMGAHMLDTSAARLRDEGVPSAAVMPLLDALELFAIGSALHETQGDSGDDQLDAGAERHPSLAKAIAERGLSSDEIYDLVNASILEAIDTAVQQRQARWMPTAEPGKDAPAAVQAPAQRGRSRKRASAK
jgi:AcrR family transcriptional regulator